MKWFLIVVLAGFLIPPAWSVMRDVLLLARTGPAHRNEARYIIQRDIIRASSRTGEIHSALRQEVVEGPSIGPTVVPAMPSRDLTRELPTCTKRDNVRRAIPRDLARDDAIFRMFDKRVSALELVTLHACLAATPFARNCAEAADAKRKRIKDDEITEELLAMGVIVRHQGKLCWTLP